MTSTVNTLGYLAPVQDVSSSLNAVESIATLDGVASTTAGVAGRSGKGLVIATGDGGASTTGSAGSASALELVGGDGGASSGGGAGGLGATLKFTAGNGGATNGNAGFIRLAPGTGNGTGVNGAVIRKLPSVASAIVAGGTIAIKDLLNGYSTVGGGAGAGYAITTPTGAQISAAIPSVAVGDMFSCILNEVGGQIMTWTAGASGVTVSGTATLAANKCAEAVFICTAANTWTTVLLNN